MLFLILLALVDVSLTARLTEPLVSGGSTARRIWDRLNPGHRPGHRSRRKRTSKGSCNLPVGRAVQRLTATFRLDSHFLQRRSNEESFSRGFQAAPVIAEHGDWEPNEFGFAENVATVSPRMLPTLLW